MANWDIFHGDRLELERGLSTVAIRDAVARGELRDDDLVRPAGSAVAWARLADIPELLAPAEPLPAPAPPVPAPIIGQPAVPKPGPAAAEHGDFEFQADDSGPMPVVSPPPTLRTPDWFELRDEPDDVAFPVIKEVPAEPKLRPGGSTAPEVPPPGGSAWAADGADAGQHEANDDFERAAPLGDDLGGDDLEILDHEADAGLDAGQEPDAQSQTSRVALPVVSSRGWDDAGAAPEAAEEDDLSLSRSGPATVEELDLAPMVDVAFQLVLFFMVTATTVLYKTLEIPKPSPEQAPSAVTQGRSRSLDDLQEDYILVEIDASGAMKIDRQPVASNMKTLVERLRTARESTHRKAMLLSAEFTTPHRSSVLAYDAANEIGLGIVIARPANPQGPAPSLRPAQQAARAPTPAESVPN